MYYFIKNLQGDVIAIVDKDTQTVARYSYDAWGVCTVTQDSVGIATINPFRYRGYFYDEEIELYYLQSRYYDASVGRFVNGDEIGLISMFGDTKINNMFIYCANDCISGVDHSGYIPWKLILVVSAGIGVGLVKVACTVASKEYKRAPGGGKFLQVIIAFLLGFIQGAIVALLAIANKTIVIGVFGGLIKVLKVLKNNKKASARKLLNAFVDGFSTVVVVSALSRLAGRVLCVKTNQIADLFISYFVEEFFN